MADLICFYDHVHNFRYVELSSLLISSSSVRREMAVFNYFLCTNAKHP